MSIKTVSDYMATVPQERVEVMERLREVINAHLPKGFREGIGYGMIGWCVPHEIYPAGYHCDPKLPLPFLNLASQKNNISLYHMGVYSNKELLDWFVGEYPKHCKSKLDMGKSCIRFKKMEDIPYDLIGELCSKITVQDWIDLYESAFQKKESE